MVAPLDLDAIRKRYDSHGDPADCANDVPDLLAEIEHLRAAVTAQRAAPHHLTAEDLRAAATACDCQGNIHDRQQLEEGQVTMPTRGREWHELSLKFMKASDAVRAAAPAEGAGRSVVVDQPGHPVSARCVLSGCHDMGDAAEGAGLDGADLDDLRWAVNQAFANSPITRERLPARFVQGVPPKSE